MGRDGFQYGVEIRKFFIISTRICCRSVCNHPFFVGIFLFLLFLYRLSPFLFSVLVYFSPVLVCTGVLLGTLLSFGETNFPLIEQDQRTLTEISESKTGSVENPVCFQRDGDIDRVSVYTELGREIVVEEALLDNIDTVGQFDVAHSSKSREFEFGNHIIDEVSSELENLEKEIEKKSSLDGPKVQVGVDVGLSNDDVNGNEFSGNIQKVDEITEVEARNFEGYKSDQGSVDAEKPDHLDNSARSWEHSDDVVEETLSPARKVQAAVLAQLKSQLESTIGSWNYFDAVVENRSSVAQKFQAENSDDYKSAEGSVDTQTSDQLESSFKAWNQLGFDQDDDDGDDDDDDEEDGSDYGSESSSPDASMTDIIPMLDELHPLLHDENPQTSDIHLGYESDQKEEEEEVGDIQSDDDQDEEAEGEETQGNKEEREKSVISWTEDDQKNLMDLGTSELERNQRLESLIARRKARRMMVERNLIDFDSMDLQFQVAPISTKRRNPFDLPHDSYDDLGLPPIPGSAPSIMMPRRNPFDLPYDSSEEKPDLMGDSFQQEFMDLYYQGEASNPRDAVFRRNETFSVWSSSIFNFGARASRFRPYFVPERTDSDMMSSSPSLQRQSSELSESKASSAPEIESPYADRDAEEKKRDEHEFGQEMEPGSEEDDQASLLVELGSHSSNDQHSLSDQETDFTPQIPEIELGVAGNSTADVSLSFDSQTQLEALMEEISSTTLKDSDLRVEDSVENDSIPREPIYDSSPQAVKKNLSSISSDFHIQSSEIHLRELSRDLLMTEESKVHEHDEQCVPDEKFLSSEVSNNTESSAGLQHEAHSSVDASEIGLVEDKSSDNNVLIPNQERDYTGVYMGGKLDTIEIEDDNGSTNNEMSFRDPILTSEDRDCSILEYSFSPVQSEVLSLTAELREDNRTENEEYQQFPVLRPDQVNHDSNNNMAEPLVSSTLDGSVDFPHDFAINCQKDNPEEQESSIDHSEVKEVGHVNNLDESLNIFAVEESQKINSPDPLYNEPFEDKPVTELEDEEHIDTYLSRELDISLSDEKIIDDFNGVTKEMDENLLSELDLIGDFGFNFPEQVVGESSPNTENRSLDESFLEDVFEPMTVIKEPNFIDFEESILDSHERDSSLGFLVAEVQSAESVEAELIRELLEASLETEFLQKDGSFEKIVESEAEKFDNGEALEQAHEAETKVGFAPFPVDRDFIEMPELSAFEANVAHSMKSSSQAEEIFGFIDSDAVEKDSEIKGIPESLLVESSIAEGNIVNSIDDEGEIGSVRFVEESDIPFFASDDQIKSLGLEESRPSLLDGDKTASLESDSLPIDSDVNVSNSIDNRDFVEMPKFSVLEANVGFIESLLVEGQIKGDGFVESALAEGNIVNSDDNEDEIGRVEYLESHAVEESIIPSFASDDQMESADSTESRPSLIDGENTASLESDSLPIHEGLKEVHEPPSNEEINEASFKEAASSEPEPLPMDNDDVKEVQKPHDDREIVPSIVPEDQTESIQPSLKCDDELEKTTSLESELLPIDSDVKEPGVDREIAPSIQSKDQAETIESPVAEANIEPGNVASNGSHHQTEVAPHVEKNELVSPKDDSHLEFSSTDSGED